MQVISLLFLGVHLLVAHAAQGPWQQCGGINWTGGTSCVTGWTCQAQNPYYSQCLQSSNSGSLTTVTTPSATPPAVSSPSSQPTSPANGGSLGPTYKTTVTFYGAGDTFGSGNCQTSTSACGFYTSPGFAAAASQNLYGAGPGAGAGPACGTCWRLTGQSDSGGAPLSNAGTSIVVMVNNLCPAQGNPLCSQTGLTGSSTNQYGATVNFDLCEDSGAKAAFFGSDGEGLAVGTAVQVNCNQWSGTVVH